MTVHILSLSDRVDEAIYSDRIRETFPRVDVVVCCGDLPFSYIEYVASCLNVPVFYVRGNHRRFEEQGGVVAPAGAVNLHRRLVRHRGLTLAGIEGSLRYKPGPGQYTQLQMWGHVLRLLPRLALRRLASGRCLDIFVSHAPPRHVHDLADPPHHGIRAFRWLLAACRPAAHFHGHVHPYGLRPSLESRLGATRVINAYGHRLVRLELPGGAGAREADRNEAGCHETHHG